MPQDTSCSAMSQEVGESLRGTAVSETDLWLVLELSGAWGPKGLEDSGLPDSVVSHLSRFVSQHKRARVQLIRRPDRANVGFTLFLANSTPGATSLHRRSFARLEELLLIDLASWAAGSALEGFELVSEPLFLICTHGKRDRCCAQLGLPVFSAIASEVGARAWQTTHLGGHRFAATLLVLPAGICYGRVAADEAPALCAAHARNELYNVARLRGRTSYSGQAQAAEALLREQLGDLQMDSLRLLGSEPAMGGQRVRFQHVPSGTAHEVWVTREALPAFPQSCGATPKPVERFVPLRLSARADIT